MIEKAFLMFKTYYGFYFKKDKLIYCLIITVSIIENKKIEFVIMLELCW